MLNYNSTLCGLVIYYPEQNDSCYPAILSQNGDLTVMGCEFGELGKLDIFLSWRIRNAVIIGNTLRTKKGIISKAGRKKTRIKNNIISYPSFKIPPRLSKKKLKEKSVLGFCPYI